MDADQLKKAEDWFNSHLTSVCNSCSRQNGFTILSKVVTPITVGDKGSVLFGGEIVPLIGVLCNHCFNIRFFSAILTGVVPKDPPLNSASPSPDA